MNVWIKREDPMAQKRSRLFNNKPQSLLIRLAGVAQTFIFGASLLLCK